MTISLKSNPDGLSGAIQVNGVDAVGFDSTGITSGVPASQAPLVSGTNIKTVGGQSILGAGDLLQAGSLPVVIVSGTSQTATAGYHYVLTNVAATTLTLPATPASGDTVWTTPMNDLLTNVIARNGQTIMSITEDITIDNADATVELRFVNNTWRLV